MSHTVTLITTRSFDLVNRQISTSPSGNGSEIVCTEVLRGAGDNISGLVDFSGDIIVVEVKVTHFDDDTLALEDAKIIRDHLAKFFNQSVVFLGELVNPASTAYLYAEDHTELSKEEADALWIIYKALSETDAKAWKWEVENALNDQFEDGDYDFDQYFDDPAEALLSTLDTEGCIIIEGEYIRMTSLGYTAIDALEEKHAAEKSEKHV